MLKPGDIICFTKDIKTNLSSFSKWSVVNFGNTLGDLIIPKDYPVELVRMNKTHVFVKFKNRLVKLRKINSRMYLAGEAAQILFSSKS